MIYVLCIATNISEELIDLPLKQKKIKNYTTLKF